MDLKQKYGPLPAWAWAALLFIIVAGYLIYKKKQSANAQAAANQNSGGSSNLGTVPVSNLTTEAEPMPIIQGDTFVNTSVTGVQGPQGPTGPQGPQGPSGSSTHQQHPIGNYGGASWSIAQGGSPGAFDLFKNGKYYGSYWLNKTYTAIKGTPFSVAGSKLSSGAYKADVKAGNKFAGVWTL